MGINWLETNNLGEPINPAWGTETRTAIEKTYPIVDGETETNGTDGVEILLGETLSVDGYRVFWSWAEDPGPGSGDVWIEYGATSFIIKNSGTTIEKKIRYFAMKGTGG